MAAILGRPVILSMVSCGSRHNPLRDLSQLWVVADVDVKQRLHAGKQVLAREIQESLCCRRVCISHAHEEGMLSMNGTDAQGYIYIYLQD